jgi:tRNA nucleotidyltransferase (CCA-adding enzyme)
VARFAARFGYAVAPETLELMAAIVAAGELEQLVAERVWAEIERALGERAPARFFEVLRECGALARVLPELDALFGVPQPPEHHPEIDTGVHTLMVLAQATRLSPEARVRFAALTHDLGKGSTPREEWPKHHGHEARSVELVRALARRLRVPNEFRDLAVAVARFHGHCHRISELRDATVLETLEALDAFRRPERFEGFVLACEADFRGRTGYEQRPYPQAGQLRAAFAAARAVDTAATVAGLNGPAAGEAIRRARIAAIRRARAAE